jgi:hypothetical protein
MLNVKVKWLIKAKINYKYKSCSSKKTLTSKLVIKRIKTYNNLSLYYFRQMNIIGVIQTNFPFWNTRKLISSTLTPAPVLCQSELPDTILATCVAFNFGSRTRKKPWLKLLLMCFLQSPFCFQFSGKRELKHRRVRICSPFYAKHS